MNRVSPIKKNHVFQKAVFCAVLVFFIMAAKNIQAQDWRLSGGYNVQQIGFNYIPNNSYPGEIRVGSKGMFEVELERYLLYRIYVAGKAELLYHNEETVFLG